MCNKYPTVSVIIPVYNAEKYLYDCLKHICDQSYSKAGYEVIVVDNASVDKSADIIKSFNVKYVYSREKGPSPSRNTGIKFAKGEYIIFIDSDCIADKELLINHIKTHQKFNENNAHVGIVGGSIGGINNSFWAICDDFCSWYLNNPGLKARYEERYLPTANLSVSKCIIDKLGGFNKSLRFGEDVDFCNRARSLGYKIYFEPKAKLYHINRTSFLSFINHAKQWASIGSTTEFTNKNNKTVEVKNILILGFYYIYYFLYRFFELVHYWLLAKRYTVLFFLPFILYNKIIFGFYMIKNRFKAKLKSSS